MRRSQAVLLLSSIFVLSSSSYGSEMGIPVILLSVTCYTNEGYFAAISEEYLDDVVKYEIDKDYKAIQKLMDAGAIVIMKKGIKVYVVETHLFSGTIEFRLPGETSVLWTVREALNCK